MTEVVALKTAISIAQDTNMQIAWTTWALSLMVLYCEMSNSNIVLCLLPLKLQYVLFTLCCRYLRRKARKVPEYDERMAQLKYSQMAEEETRSEPLEADWSGVD